MCSHQFPYRERASLKMHTKLALSVVETGQKNTLQIVIYYQAECNFMELCSRMLLDLYKCILSCGYCLVNTLRNPLSTLYTQYEVSVLIKFRKLLCFTEAKLLCHFSIKSYSMCTLRGDSYW